MQAIYQFTMGGYILHMLTLGKLVNGLFSSCFAGVLSGNLEQNIWKNYVTLSEATLKSAKAIPWEFPDILLFSQIPWGAW